MNNGDLPINPQPVCADGRAWIKSDLGHESQVIGLTKREHFAIMAMQGIISAVLAGGCNPVSYTEIAKDAITAADELLKAIGDL